jgi:hypothetical protein
MQDFNILLQRGSRFFSLSFFLSGTINFFLALRVFTHIDSSLSDAQRSQILNEQIAHMTWLSLGMIAIPLLCFTGLFLYWFFKQLSGLTGLKIDELTVD